MRRFEIRGRPNWDCEDDLNVNGAAVVSAGPSDQEAILGVINHLRAWRQISDDVDRRRYTEQLP